MGADITASFLTCVAVAIAAMVGPRGDYGRLRICAFWAAVAIIGFFSPFGWLRFCLFAAAMLVAAPLDPARRVIFYCATFFAFPIAESVQIPFPGLNYLITLDFSKLAAFFILAPLLPAAMKVRPPEAMRLLDAAVVAYVLLISVLVIRDMPFTTMLRFSFYNVLLFILPYFVITRILVSSDQFDDLLKAIGLAAIIICGIGVMTTLVNWNYYAEFFEARTAKPYLDRRNGFLRVYTTMNPPLVVFILALGFVALWKSWAKQPAFVLRMAAFGLVFAFVAFTTGSRGGWLAAIAALTTYFVMSKFGAGIRRLYVLGLCLGAAGFFVSVVTGGISFSSDPYGTLSYRAELLRTSLAQIGEHPIFGKPGIRQSEDFEHLRQGEGIVDLVNLYLNVTLHNGLVGLTLFMMMMILPLTAGVRLINNLDRSLHDGSAIRAAAAFLAFQIGFVALIATTSGVHYVWHFGVLTVSLLAALNMVLKHAPATVETVVQGEDADAAPVDAPKPYGARFVRSQ